MLCRSWVAETSALFPSCRYDTQSDQSRSTNKISETVSVWLLHGCLNVLLSLYTLNTTTASRCTEQDMLDNSFLAGVGFSVKCDFCVSAMLPVCHPQTYCRQLNLFSSTVHVTWNVNLLSKYGVGGWRSFKVLLVFQTSPLIKASTWTCNYTTI